MERKRKLFVGLELDEPARDALVDVGARLASRRVKARFEARDKLHITVAFLGWVLPDIVPQINQTLARVANAHEHFVLQLDKMSAFPNERRPSLAWVGAHKVPRQFSQLTASTRAALGALGFVFKKDAVAHVTICRLKDFDRPLPAVKEFGPIDVTVREIALFESVHGGQTTHYEVLGRAALVPEGIIKNVETANARCLSA